MSQRDEDSFENWLSQADAELSAAVSASVDTDAVLRHVTQHVTNAPAETEAAPRAHAGAERDPAVHQATDRTHQQVAPPALENAGIDAAAPAPPSSSGGGWRLSSETQRKLISAGTARLWSRGQALIRESETSDHVILLTGGHVKVSMTAPSGRPVVMAIRGPGDLLGETSAIDGDAQPATVTALTAVEGVSLTGEEFHQFMSDAPSATLDLLKMAVSRLRESTQQRRLEHGAYDVPARTAWLLVEYARDHGEPVRGGLTVNLRQSELAEATGASREAVAKALKVFRDAGAIRANRTSFDVLRMDLLDRFAEGIA